MMQIYFTVIAFPIGIVLFLLLSYHRKAHLRTIRDLFIFFLRPFPPLRMLSIIEIDGTPRVYYDNEFAEINSSKRNVIKTIYGDLYVTDFAFSNSKTVVSMYDARSPSGIASPMGLAWRWALSSSFTFYFLYLAFIFELLSDVFRPGPFVYYTILFMGYGMWFITNIVRMADSTIEYAWYFEYSITPPFRRIVPVPGHSSISVIQFLSALEEIRIVVPDSLRDFIKSLSRDIGGEDMAAIMAAKLSVAEQWRNMLAKVLRDIFKFRKAGEADAMLRLSISGQPKLFYIGLALVIGIFIGYMLGNIFTFTVEPALHEPGNATLSEPVPPTPPPPPGGEPGSPPVEPPTPPPPPGGGGEGPQPPSPPPPP